MIGTERQRHGQACDCGLDDCAGGTFAFSRTAFAQTSSTRDSRARARPSGAAERDPRSLMYSVAYRVARATPFAAFAMMSATARGCDT